MAEEADVPPLAPALSDRNCSRRSPAPDSSSSTSQDASQRQCPSIHPSTAPVVIPLQNPGQSDHGPGLYAVPTFLPFMGIMSDSPPSTLIPLTYKIPTRANSTGTSGEVQGQEARQQQGPQRQVVVRRFHFAIQLDLALIIKLAAVVFLFSQEGSRQRFILLVLFASFIYLYQTGALAPLLRWIRRGGTHPQPRPVIRPEQPPLAHVDGNQPQPEGNLQAENENQLAQNGLPPAEAVDENPPEHVRQDRNQRWGILKEIQMFVIGFITSLLPGFHHHNN